MKYYMLEKKPVFIHTENFCLNDGCTEFLINFEMDKINIYILLIKQLITKKKYNKSNTKVIQFFEIFKKYPCF